MAKEEEKKEAAPAPAADGSSGGGGSGKLGVILTIVNLVLTLGIGAVVFIQFKKDKNSEHVADVSLAEEGHGAAAGGGGHGEAAKAEGGHGGGGGGGHGEGPAKPKNTVVTFEMFTVNLSTAVGANPKYIRVVVSVDAGSEEALNELNSKIPQARNAIIDLFNSKRPSDLQTGEGRNFVKEEIRNALNSFLVSGKIKAVYFSNYSVT